MQREHFFKCGGELPARFDMSLFDSRGDPVKSTENEGVFGPALVQMPVAERFQNSFLVAQASFDSGDQMLEIAGEIGIRFRLNLPDAMTQGLMHVAQDGAIGAPGGFAGR